MLQQDKNSAKANNSSLCNTSSGENTATKYSFNVEAVNEYFADVVTVKQFAKSMREYNFFASLRFMSDCTTGTGYIPREVYLAIESFNNFLEVLDPYFTTPKNK
jgi:hypothetical protein